LIVFLKKGAGIASPLDIPSVPVPLLFNRLHTFALDSKERKLIHSTEQFDYTRIFNVLMRVGCP
jgi:hypothetical protein